MKVALFCGHGDTAAAVANRLKGEFPDLAIVVEGKEPRRLFLRRRVRMLGLVTVLGQVAFMFAANPILRRLSGPRIAEILTRSSISTSTAVFKGAYEVDSINDDAVVEWLRANRPEVVVVNGTRIIKRRILDVAEATFINTHCGITPMYRGAHGGYWALKAGDRSNCGVTVHLVDAGIDTGAIVGQRIIDPSRSDNLVTYPYLQIEAALLVLVQSVRDALAGRVETTATSGPSGVWYHPTLWGYLWTGITRGVW